MHGSPRVSLHPKALKWTRFDRKSKPVGESPDEVFASCGKRSTSPTDNHSELPNKRQQVSRSKDYDISEVVVDLSTIHGPNYLVISAKARQEFLSAIKEAMNMEFSNPAGRRYVTQLAMKFLHIWGVSLRGSGWKYGSVFVDGIFPGEIPLVAAPKCWLGDLNHQEVLGLHQAFGPSTVFLLGEAYLWIVALCPFIRIFTC
nr:tortifolia1-like protein 2 [Quercus suber]